MGDEDARMSAPAALRNSDFILEQLLRFAPETGRALEIASGTGEHIIRFAPATPGLTWQPTDPDPARRASIAAWAEGASAPNLLPPRDLDAAEPGWSAAYASQDVILLVNLLHLLPQTAVDTILTEIAAALAPGGIAMIYGPFLRDGIATSEGDAMFDQNLRAQDPAIGYKDITAVEAALTGLGLSHLETVQMPANNLFLVFQRNSVT